MLVIRYFVTDHLEIITLLYSVLLYMIMCRLFVRPFSQCIRPSQLTCSPRRASLKSFPLVFKKSAFRWEGMKAESKVGFMAGKENRRESVIC